MKQDISYNGELSPLAPHHVVLQGIAGACDNKRNISIHQEECAVPSTPWTRQNSFNDALKLEGVERISNAGLRVEGYFDALDSDPALAHAIFAHKVGAAGLAELRNQAPNGRLIVSTEILG